MKFERIVFTTRLTSIGDTIISAKSFLRLLRNDYYPIFLTSKENFDIAKLIPKLTFFILINQNHLTYYSGENQKFIEISKDDFLEKIKQIPTQKKPVTLDLQKTKRSKNALKNLKKTLNLPFEKNYSVSKRTLFRFLLILKSLFTWKQEFRKKQNFKLLRIHDLQKNAINALLHHDKKVFIDLHPNEKTLSFPHSYPITAHKDMICIFPGASSFLKTWPKEYFTKLIELLLQKTEYKIAICGSKQESYLKEYFDFFQNPRVLNLIEQLELSETLSVIAHSKYVITADSFPAHAADAYKVPATVLFGSTSPLFGFVPEYSEIQILYQNLSCSPCTRHGKHVCRFKNLNCLTSIQPEMVFDSLKLPVKK
ncbi:MAG: glycosyltransferase family 9 protein [Silvanigrellaceae bacterium]|nr:glycosyltransferase family 9 protein [Silvanigrellaceae bacterium]